MSENKESERKTEELDNEGLNWYYAVYNGSKDIIEFIEHFEGEYEKARLEVRLDGMGLEEASRRIPGIFEHRYSQWQQIEAVLSLLEVQLEKLISESLQAFSANYGRDMSSKDQMSWIKGEDKIVAQKELIILVSLLRNNYNGLTKALEAKQFQIGHILKMRLAGFGADDLKFDDYKGHNA